MKDKRIENVIIREKKHAHKLNDRQAQAIQKYSKSFYFKHPLKPIVGKIGTVVRVNMSDCKQGKNSALRLFLSRYNMSRIEVPIQMIGNLLFKI